jgi:hypothetical protein
MKFNLKILFYCFTFILVSCDNSQTFFKKKLIDNYDRGYFYCTDSNNLDNPNSCVYILDSLPGYYTELTLSFHSDSSYTITAWGKRDSFMWPILGDKQIHSSVPYDRYKGKSVDLDIKLINKFSKHNKHEKY